jgi:hypothetical protein
MKFRVLAALSAIGCLFASAPAPAGYQYVLTGITAGEVIPIGTTRTVNVFLNYDGSGPANVLPGGLFSAWSALRYTTNASASLTVVSPPQPDGAPPTATTGIKANPDFNDSTTRGPTAGNTAFSNETGYTRLYALLAGSTLATQNYATSTSANNTANGGTATSLYIGSFNLQTGNTAGANVPITLRANLYDLTSGANILTAQFASLDAATAAGSVSFTIAGVPEPGTMALVGFAATGFGGVLWRKRRTAAKAKSEE